MIELLSVSHSVLRDQGFATRVISVGQLSGLAFEDDTVLGFVYAFDGPVEMLEHWQDVEKEFSSIQRHPISGSKRKGVEYLQRVFDLRKRRC